MTHQLQGSGERFQGPERDKGRSAVQQPTVGGIAHPGRQGSEKSGSLFYQDRIRTVSAAAIAGVQNAAE